MIKQALMSQMLEEIAQIVEIKAEWEKGMSPEKRASSTK
jgi:hypothetical protein